MYNDCAMLRKRYRRIVWFFVRVLANLAWWDILLPKIALKRIAKSTRKKRLQRYAAAFRRLAVSMGGVMIKVGQFLSARVDVLPIEITGELEGLQDEVPPEEYATILQVIENEYSTPIEEQFSWFDKEPLAAASLGQVHRARILHNPWSAKQSEFQDNEANVVVKIQRPDIENIIATDLAALRMIGKWLHRYPPIRRRAHIPALLDEFTRTLYEEIDYLSEGQNAERFAVNFRADAGVRVPRVAWQQTTQRCLTLEDVWAIKITDYQAIEEAGIDRGEVAARLLDTYLKQIFEDGFFHADPHPGNLFVQPLPFPENDQASKGQPFVLTFVDFGMVGKVPPNLRKGLRELLIGVGTQDASRVIKAYQLMDILLPDADLALLEKAEAKAFELYWGKSMSELASISMQEVHKFALEFRELMFEMPFQVPQNMIFLGRAVGILSGMCTGLDNDFNLWMHLAPYAEKLVAKELAASRGTWFAELEKLVRLLFVLPRKMETTLTRLERGEVTLRDPDLSRQVHHLESAVRQMAGALLCGAFILGAVQLYLGGQIILAGVAACAAALSMIGVIYQRRK